MAAIACGLVSIGTCNGDVTSTILQTMMERSETEVKDTNARNLALGLGLTFLGKSPSNSGSKSEFSLQLAICFIASCLEEILGISR